LLSIYYLEKKELGMVFMENIVVFVYGTLRAGEGNHRVIAPHIVRALGEGHIQGRMYDWKAYPVVCLEQPGVVVGEWYEIERSGLPYLDRLEGYPTLYQRSIVSDISRNISGYVYHMEAVKAARRSQGVVVSGDWLCRAAVAGI
jgi:gamma-glutamylcyclotransferase (GGCT)/AIG2-like uncharacterized protein YtfP